MIAAFDVGIANLAVCILDNDKIIKWDILNICSNNNKCCKTLRNKSQCSKIAHYKDKENYYCSQHKNNNCCKIKKNEKDDLYSYGVNMYKLLDDIPELLKCEKIMIENQPVLKNPTIKSISMLLFSYFINKNENIYFINASNKLKINEKYTNEQLRQSKNKYNTRKKLSIKYTDKILSEIKIDNTLLLFYINHKKKDDLADALLYCYYEKYGKNSLKFD